MQHKITGFLLVGAVGFLLTGCGGVHGNDSTHNNAATSEPDTARIVEEEVKQHIEALNHDKAGIKTVSCRERGPVPSMGTEAVAFLCTFDGETAKAELWAKLPMDQEEPVMPLDLTAERELAARGEVSGLNDGHSEADNRSAEEDIHHAEEEVSQEGSASTTTGPTSSSTSGPARNSSEVSGKCAVEEGVQSFISFPEIADLTASGTSCQTANAVAMAMKVAGASQTPFPHGQFSLGKAEGEQHYQCVYRNLNPRYNEEEGVTATCRGPGKALVTMQLNS